MPAGITRPARPRSLPLVVLACAFIKDVTIAMTDCGIGVLVEKRGTLEHSTSNSENRLGVSVQCNPTSIQRAAKGDIEAAMKNPRLRGGARISEHLHRWRHHPT